jgi:hypothetical protein
MFEVQNLETRNGQKSWRLFLSRMAATLVHPLLPVDPMIMQTLNG